MQKRWFGISLLAIFLITSGAVCKNQGDPPQSVTLNYWTVFNDQEDLKPLIAAYNAVYPQVKINVRRLTPEEYEDKLIESWAEGIGPDIFSVQNSHVGKFQDFIEPMPASLAMVATQADGKNVQYVPQTIRTISTQQLSSLFPQVVFDDAVLLHKGNSDDKATEKIFGLPYSLDTLALYYNKDMLSQAKIALPADTWEQFVEHVPKLTLVDVDNNIIQSGAALGTSNNVPNMFDIVSILMMQNGATMSNGNRVVFDGADSEQRDYFPGQQAVDFYTSFANEDVEWYTWNADQPDALEAFINGETAYFLGYHYQLNQIQNESGNMNFDIAPLPQVDINNDISYANYWLETVSINSKHPNEAWAFVEMVTTDQAISQQYLDATERPAALKTLIQQQQEDYILSIFANQSLTAESWYTGQEPAVAEEEFANMISAINEDRIDIPTAVRNTADKIELTYE